VRGASFLLYLFLAQGRLVELVSFSILNLYVTTKWEEPPSYLFLAQERWRDVMSFSIVNLYLLREGSLLPTYSWPGGEGRVTGLTHPKSLPTILRAKMKNKIEKDKFKM
jgi:hypothetical protein